MNLEFFILFFDYFRTLELRDGLFEVGIPFLISLGVFYVLFTGHDYSSVSLFNTNIIRLLAILIGFSITIIVILSTNSGKAIRNIKDFITKKEINGEKISLFREMLINFSYSVVVSITVVAGCLVYPFVLDNYEVSFLVKLIVFCSIVFLVFHILCLNIRNLTNFFFILSKKD